MADSIRQFIARRLKENVPLSDIREDLKKKGYGIEAINKAVREAIGNVDKSLSSTATVQIVVLIIGVAIAIGAGVYLTAGYKTSQATPVSDGSVVEACKSYPKVAYELPCEDAASLALEKYAGKIFGVAKAKYNFTLGEAPNLRLEEKEVWFITIVLDKTLETNLVNTDFVNFVVDVKNKNLYTVTFR